MMAGGLQCVVVSSATPFAINVLVNMLSFDATGREAAAAVDKQLGAN